MIVPSTSFNLRVFNRNHRHGHGHVSVSAVAWWSRLSLSSHPVRSVDTEPHRVSRTVFAQSAVAVPML